MLPQKLSDVRFTNPAFMIGLQFVNLRLVKVMLRYINDGVMTIKPGHQKTANVSMIWSDELSFTLLPTSGRVYIWKAPKEAYNPGSYNGLGSSIVWSPITLHGRITARECMDRLDNQMHPMIQDNNVAIQTAGTVQSRFEEHEGELQHLPWSAQSPGLNIIKPLWSVLGIRVRNKFPPPVSLKKFENVLQEEWYKVLFEIVQNLYESIPKKDCSSIEGKTWPNTISIKICIQYL
jgi:hypothetical protein